MPTLSEPENGGCNDGTAQWRYLRSLDGVEAARVDAGARLHVAVEVERLAQGRPLVVGGQPLAAPLREGLRRVGEDARDRVVGARLGEAVLPRSRAGAARRVDPLLELGVRHGVLADVEAVLVVELDVEHAVGEPLEVVEPPLDLHELRRAGDEAARLLDLATGAGEVATVEGLAGAIDRGEAALELHRVLASADDLGDLRVEVRTAALLPREVLDGLERRDRAVVVPDRRGPLGRGERVVDLALLRQETLQASARRLERLIRGAVPLRLVERVERLLEASRLLLAVGIRERRLAEPLDLAQGRHALFARRRRRRRARHGRGRRGGFLGSGRDDDRPLRGRTADHVVVVARSHDPPNATDPDQDPAHDERPRRGRKAGIARTSYPPEGRSVVVAGFGDPGSVGHGPGRRHHPACRADRRGATGTCVCPRENNSRNWETNVNALDRRVRRNGDDQRSPRTSPRWHRASSSQKQRSVTVSPARLRRRRAARASFASGPFISALKLRTYSPNGRGGRSRATTRPPFLLRP